MDKSPIDVSLRKLFEIKLKQGVAMKKVQLDESSAFRGIYFLKGTKLCKINLQTKKIIECEPTKNKEIVYITGNTNNDSLICVMKNGTVISIDPDNKIKNYSNLNISHLIAKKYTSPEDVEIFANNSLDKFVVVTENFITIWYKNNMAIYNGETVGSFFNIVKDTEKKKSGIQPNSKNNFVQSKITATFSNDFYLGSHIRIFYIITETIPKSQQTRVTIIDFIFTFDYNDKFRSAPDFPMQLIDTCNNLYNTDEIEDITDIKTKYTNNIISLKESESSHSLANMKIIVKANAYGNMLAICLNYAMMKNIRIIFMMCESYKFTSCPLSKMIGEKLGPNLNISNMEWVCNDMFLLILTSTGTFIVINVNFQVIQINDLSNTVLPEDYYYTPIYYNINKLKGNDCAKLLSTKQRDDVFLIYSTIYSICFQINSKTYENRLISMPIPNENFEDFLFEIKYFQMFLSSSDIEMSPEIDPSMNVFDIIHKYMVDMMAGTKSHLFFNYNAGETGVNEGSPVNRITTNPKNTLTTKELGTKNSNNPVFSANSTAMKSETVNNLMRTFVKYIRIFNNINLIHETNLTIISYLIGRSHDFFIHLINHQEIWLAVLFVELCEKNLCEPLLLKHPAHKGKKTLQNILFNPKTEQNLSFESYKFINNKLIYSRMRIILIFFFLIEFRNNFALNINVLYFVLAKFITEKVKKNDLVCDIMQVAKIIVKNYKYLKSENDKIGKDEFVLNSLSMSFRNDIFSDFKITQSERTDINFSFFNEFYSLDELTSFNDANENYCKNEETNLLTEYNYLNNIGILQRWVIFFTNYLYGELFQDYKNYIDNHLRQMEVKNEENTSPEEKTLSKLIYFNITFFAQGLITYLKKFFEIITDNVFDNYNKIYIKFISPIEVPFIIFEFYIAETNQDQKTLPYEINANLAKIIERKSKDYNITIDDILDFVEFLISNGFSYDKESMDESFSAPQKYLQQYIYSGFIFYIFIMHKFNLIYLLESDQEMILKIIDCFDIKQKKSCYELFYVICNGHLRQYLKIEENSKISQNDGKFLQIILVTMKMLFYKIIREEPFEIRDNISNFLQITPSIMKSYLLEGALYYEYKNYNKLIKSSLFCFSGALNLKNLNDPAFDRKKNIFDLILENPSGSIISKLFPLKKPKPDFISNLHISLYNILSFCVIPSYYNSSTKASSNNLSKINNTNILIFNIENNKEYIRKLILSSVSNIVQTDNFDNEICPEYYLYPTIEKIIKGNFEDKKNFEFTNSEFKQKLVKSIKTVILKFLHLVNIIDIKFKLFSIDPYKEQLTYIRLLSIVLLYERNFQIAYETYIKVIDYVHHVNFAEIKKEADVENIVETLKNIHVISLKYKKNDHISRMITNIELKMEKENKLIKGKYIQFLVDDFTKVSEVYEKVKTSKSQNLLNFCISSFNDFYLDNMYKIYEQLYKYLTKADIGNRVPLEKARKKYLNLSESFYNMTGIPMKSFMDFKQNWQLCEMNDLFNGIISDDFKENTNAKSKEKSNFVMSNRTKTPRKNKRKILNTPTTTSGSDSNRSYSKKRRPSTDSLQIREEKNQKNTKGIKAKNKLPLPMKYLNNMKTVSGSKKVSKKNIEELKNAVMKLLFNKIKEKLTRHRKLVPEANTEENTQMTSNKSEADSHKDIFSPLKTQPSNSSSSLHKLGSFGEIKLYNIKRSSSKSKGEQSTEVIILKEKSCKSNAEGRKVFNSIKPLDFIKYTTKKNPDKKTEPRKDSEDKMKSKLDELTEKLKQYENMVNNLGKDYTGSVFNKKNK